MLYWTSKKLYQAFKEFGIDNFSFEVIDYGSNYNELEKKQIKYYDSYNNGYNSTPGGDEKGIHFGQPIEVYDLNGNYITTYPNMTYAAKEIGVSRNTIYTIIHNNRLSTKGYQLKKLNHIKVAKVVS